MAKSLLYSKQIDITDKIKIYIPTVGEVFDNEEEYYRLVALITATPFDMMVQLDDMHIDFTDINEFELFCLLFSQIQKSDTRLLFGDLDLSNFRFAVNESNGNIFFRDEKQSISIDRAIHSKIGRALREINFFEKNNKRPANEEAKKYLLERMRIKQQRALNKMKKSQLEDLILAMVNTSEYHYNFDSTRELSIFQFNASVRQVIKKINYDNTMIGCYAGTVNAKDLNPDQLNWLTNK